MVHDAAVYTQNGWQEEVDSTGRTTRDRNTNEIPSAGVTKHLGYTTRVLRRQVMIMMDIMTSITSAGVVQLL